MSATPDPLTEHQRVVTEERAARTAQAKAVADVRRLEMQLRQKDSQRVDEYAKKARQQDAQVDRVEKERSTLLAELDLANAAAAGAARAGAQAHDEREALYETHLAAFAEAADPYSEKATQAWSKLERAYRDAETAWAEARAAWAPLRPAIRKAIREAQLRADVISGDEIRDSAVPEFPLNTNELAKQFFSERFAAVQNGALAPRPPALKAERASSPVS